MQDEYYLVKRIDRAYGREDVSHMALLTGSWVGFSLISSKVKEPFRFPTYEMAVNAVRKYQKERLNVEVDIIKCMVIAEKAATLSPVDSVPAGLVK
jgi:hypothetical protein